MSDKSKRDGGDHQGLLFKSIQTIVKYDSGVTVDWLAERHDTRTDKDNTKYTVTVNGKPDVAYSLFTLLIQPANFDLLVKNIGASGEVTLIDDLKKPHTLTPEGMTVPGTGKKSYGLHDKNGIWFLKFTGTECTLAIEVDLKKPRVKFGRTAWADPSKPTPRGGFKMMESHSNVPPGGTTEK